ncbi:MAG: hypothetical protein JWP95_760, partial [Actinotalea sp.]|nr:hypothetical protein [Actinotalea sp.]
RITTDAGFTLEQVATGVLVWTTPTGHRYVRKPDGLAPARARGDGPLRSRVGALVSTALDEGARRGGGCLPLDDPPF